MYFIIYNYFDFSYFGAVFLTEADQKRIWFNMYKTQEAKQYLT